MKAQVSELIGQLKVEKVSRETAFWKTFESWAHGRVEKLDLNKTRPDDSLNIAECWTNFGNWKEKGLNPSHNYQWYTPELEYRDWVGLVPVNKEQKSFVWDLDDNSFYEVLEGGNPSHSEDNTKPNRFYFGAKLQNPGDGYDFEKLQYLLDNRESIEKELDEVYEKYREEATRPFILLKQQVLEFLKEELETYKKEHPRGKKRVAILKKEIANTTRLIENVKSGRIRMY